MPLSRPTVKSCLNLRQHVSTAGHKCLKVVGLEASAPKAKTLQISAPFDFKTGPSVPFPGFSESEISLMKEKAIASTAVVSSEHEYPDYTTFRSTTSSPPPPPQASSSSRRTSQYPLGHARIDSHASSIRHRVVLHARRVSRTHFQ
ncbi:hypothetical protein PVAG01_10176 [Phlyctema vagabunda]|uniref:Uncharacterized protein n=1 Tax=Phlyctema vagabunda TaxID=108571 RepID=A0ABR4P566_9HELO